MEKWMRVEEARTYRTKKPRLESVVSLFFGTLLDLGYRVAGQIDTQLVEYLAIYLAQHHR